MVISHCHRALGKAQPNYYLVGKNVEMAHVDRLRNGIIDKLLAISDKEYLTALLRLVDTSSVQDEKIKLTKEQKLMLAMSENDIQNGRLISQSDLDKSDLEWLKGK